MLESAEPTPHTRVEGMGGVERPRARRSRAELRELLLESGRNLLLTEGLGNGAEHLSFKRVLDHVADTQGIRITNASVIGRVWDNQEEFQLDVVRSLVEREGQLELEDTTEAISEALGRVNLSTPEMRRASLAELIRVGCAQYLESASSSSTTIEMALITYMAATQSVSGSRMVGSYRAASALLGERYAGLYEAGLAALGWRMRSDRTVRELAATLTAFAEGIVLRQIIEPTAFSPVLQIRALDGQEVEWTPLAVALDSLIEFFAEPDPEWSA